MIGTKSDRRDDEQLFALLAVLWILGSMMMIGPIGLVAAVLAIIIAILSGSRIGGGLIIAGCGAAIGTAMWGLRGWLFGPLNSMAQIYRDFLFQGFRWDTDGLWFLFGKMLLNGEAWTFFGPLGIAAGGLYWTIWVLHTGSPLKQTARGKPAHRAPIALFARFAKRRADQAEAATEGGTLLGVDQTSRRRVQLTDTDANKHTFVLGTIGSGKTVTVLNFVESAICRCLPLIYVDGKGDYDLAEKVIAYAEACGRPAYLFAMNGASCVYNPLATGGFSAKKDRIIELRHWSEDHYLKIAEGYMQTVFKVLEACGVQTDLVTVADYMDVEQLRNLIAARKPANATRLTAEVDRQEKAEPDVRSLCNEVINLATSEIGHLFDTANAPSHVPVLELLRAVEERAIVYFCLPALQFPALARTLGRLVINDLKSTVAEQLSKPEAARPVIYTVFDEFSVFAGEQVLNLINMGRSAGVRAVLATQSVADIGRAVTDSPDHFIRQVFASCNSYVIQRLNAAEDATTIVEMIGTKDGVEHTAQVDSIGATGLGSARRTKTFIVHPDAIKTQPMGHAVFVNKNRGTVQRILVRRGNIG